MVGLNNIREAYEQVYAQMDERIDPEERALRRAEIADKKASRMDAKVASKYAGSEARSAEREDKKSRGKHIHGMADSVELDGELVDEALRKPSQIAKKQKLSDLLKQRHEKNEKARKEMMDTQAHKDMVKAAMRHFEGVEIGEESYMDYARRKAAERKDTRMTVTAADKKGNTLAWQKYKSGDKRYKAASHVGEETILERELDPTEKREKERLVKGLKKSASDFKKRYGERAKSVMYATATKMAKDRMDTSKSDRRYGVEG